MLTQQKKAHSCFTSVILSFVILFTPYMQFGCSATINTTIISDKTTTEIIHRNQRKLEHSYCDASFEPRTGKITLRSSERCEIESQEIYKRRVEIDRTLSDSSTGLLVFGSINSLLGITLLATAHKFSDVEKKSLFLDFITIIDDAVRDDGEDAPWEDDPWEDDDEGTTWNNRRSGYIFGGLFTLTGLISLYCYWNVWRKTGKEVQKSESFGASSLKQISCGESTVLQNQKVKVRAIIDGRLHSEADLETDIDGTLNVDALSLKLNEFSEPGIDIDLEFQASELEACTLSTQLGFLLYKANH